MDKASALILTIIVVGGLLLALYRWLGFLDQLRLSRINEDNKDAAKRASGEGR